MIQEETPAQHKHDNRNGAKEYGGEKWNPSQSRHGYAIEKIRRYATKKHVISLYEYQEKYAKKEAQPPRQYKNTKIKKHAAANAKCLTLQ